MKRGNCFTCRCSRGSHCLLTASGCGSVLRNKSRAKDTSSLFLGAPAYGAGLTLLLMDAGCVDGYAGFQRIFRMGTLWQLGRQRFCR